MEELEGKVRRFLPVLVGVCATLPFLPSLRNGFVNLDDEWNLVLNWHYQGLGLPQLRWMFTSSIGHGNYEPLHWLALGVVYSVFGPGPWGFHAAALLIHALAAGLLYLVARDLIASALPSRGPLEIELSAAAGALLYAVHPLRAEAVCWVSAQHYPLATAFALSSVLAYLRWRRAAANARWLWLSVAAFAASQLSLPVALTLPVALLILDVYPLRRLESAPPRALILEKVPYIVLSALGLATWFARAVVLRIPSAPRVLDMLVFPWSSAFFCLSQTVVPIGLRPIYQPLGGIRAADPGLWMPALAAISATFFLARRREEWPATAAAWGFFLIALLPVSGFVPNGLFPSQPGDRYSYLPSVGLAVLAAGGLVVLASKGARAFKAGLSCAVAVILIWSALSWRQTRIWRDSPTLWDRCLVLGEDGPTVHIGAGYSLVEQGRIDEAIPHLQKAADQEPAALLPYYTLGWALDRAGKPEEALRYFELALERDHGSAAAWNASGSELAKMGKTKDAAARFSKAIALDAQHPGAHMNLALCLADMGRIEAAIEEYRLALDINPNFSEARCNLALDLLRMGRASEAAREFQEVKRRDPAYLRARTDLRQTLLGLGLSPARSFT